jgi:uncharacterized protein (DUF983 family)
VIAAARYAFIDSGDGPAVFAIFILGFVVLGGALFAEFKLHVPVWLHIVLWGIIALRRSSPGPEGDAIALQFHKAEQAARLD